MPVDPVIGNIAGGIGAAISSIGSGRRQRRNIQEQKKADKELAEYSYSKDLEQWERENAYNTPLSQMGRFREAGLNPHLIYGQGTPDNVQSSSPKYQQVRTQVGRKPLFDPGSVLGAFQDFSMKNSQIDNVRLQNNAKTIENRYLEQMLFNKQWGDKEKYKGWQLDNLFDLMGPRGINYTDEAGDKFPLLKSLRGRRMSMELKKGSGQIQYLESGNMLRQLEAKWFEQLKALGIFRGLIRGGR